MEMEEAIDDHLAMQMGCYFSRRDLGVGGAQFLSAELITDPAWNFGVVRGEVREESITSVMEMASWRRRRPAVFTRSPERILEVAERVGLTSHREPERWMMADLTMVDTTDQPANVSELRFSNDASPDSDFCDVFGNLFADSEMNAHFEVFYIPTLKRAVASEGTRYVHSVAYDQNGQAIGCGSAYIRGDRCGLYNVGTVAKSQKHGVGAWLSRQTLKLARDRGARAAFLQCEVGNHVERLYSGIGFRIMDTPEIVEFRNG